MKLIVCFILVSWVPVKVSSIGNLAVGKTAYQSSTYSHHFNVGAGKAVDGNSNTVFDGQSCTHTKIEANPWWVVDLGKTQSIARIAIKNRADFGNRLQNVWVGVSNSFNQNSFNKASFSTCIQASSTYSNGQTVWLSCTSVKRGRYVAITTQGPLLTLCEVFIYGPIDYQRWMSGLPDNFNIRDLTIPGTHDTATWNGQNAWVKCQDWTLTKQLNNGVRFLDIRGRHYKNGLAIHHGAYYQNMGMGSIMNTCVNFLNKHPTEFIVMRIKQEHTATSNTRSYKQTLQTYLNPSSRFWTSSSIPTVAQARGKIVIMNQWDGSTLGIKFLSQQIKDDYKVHTHFHIKGKWNGCRDHIQQAVQSYRSSSSQKLWITFFSGTGAPTPRSVANSVNSKLSDYVNDNPGSYRWGIMVMDFPWLSNIMQIIDENKHI